MVDYSTLKYMRDPQIMIAAPVKVLRGPQGPRIFLLGLIRYQTSDSVNVLTKVAQRSKVKVSVRYDVPSSTIQTPLHNEHCQYQCLVHIVA